MTVYFRVTGAIVLFLVVFKFTARLSRAQNRAVVKINAKNDQLCLYYDSCVQ